MARMQFKRRWDFDDPDTLLTRGDLANPDKQVLTAFQTLAGTLVPSEVTAQLPARVTSEVAYQLPSSVAARVASVLPAAVTSEVGVQVPPAVTSALAADTTVKNAAASAATTAVQQAGVISGTYPAALGDDTAFVVTDANDRRSWLEVGPDGGPTARVKAIIGAAGKNAIGLDTSTVTALGRSFSITGASDREALYIDDAGAVGVPKFDSPTRQQILDIAGAAAVGTASTYKSSYQTASRPMVSGPDVVLVGHSMLSGANSAIVTAFAPVTVRNLAVGGETSLSIAARQGGQPATFLPVGGVIPASGPVEVTLGYAGGGTAWPLLQGASTYTGWLVGLDGTQIPGTFSMTRDPAMTVSTSHYPGDQYFFTRTTPGSAITADRPLPFYYDAGEARRGDITIYWPGRNNLSSTDQVVGDLQAMIQHQTPVSKRFLVLAEHNGLTETPGSSTYNSIMALNDRYRYLYGRRFVDGRKYLIQYGLADAGITPTTQDNTDIANDVVPTSLRGDALHLNTAGSTVLATLLKRRALEFGWI